MRYTQYFLSLLLILTPFAAPPALAQVALQGGSHGSGGDAGLKPPSRMLSSNEIKTKTRFMIEDLTLFRAYFIAYRNRLETYLALADWGLQSPTPGTNQPELRKFKEDTSSLLKLLYRQPQTIFNIVNSFTLEKVDFNTTGPCVDSAGSEKDAVANRSNGRICVSTFRLGNRFNSEEAGRRIFAILVHELSHLVGTSEVQAVMLQTEALEIASPVQLRTFRPSIGQNLKKMIFTTKYIQGLMNDAKSPDELMINVYLYRNLNSLQELIEQIGKTNAQQSLTGFWEMDPEARKISGILERKLHFLNRYIQVKKTDAEIIWPELKTRNYILDPKDTSQEPLKIVVPTRGDINALKAAIASITDDLMSLDRLLDSYKK